MTVGSINGAALPCANNNAGTDSVAKSIQNQIANAKKQLQELASNKDLPPEEKMKKKQEIQQEINSLNQQLRQHTIEKRNEQRQKMQNTSQADGLTGGNRTAGAAKQGGKECGLPQAGMQAMISADSAMKQAKVQGSAARGLEGKAGVLKAEIKQDSGRGGNVEKKREQLANVENKALAAETGQISSLADANQKVKEAQEADRKETADQKEDKADRKESAESKNEKENAAGIGANVDVRL